MQACFDAQYQFSACDASREKLTEEEVAERQGRYGAPLDAARIEQFETICDQVTAAHYQTIWYRGVDLGQTETGENVASFLHVQYWNDEITLDELIGILQAEEIRARRSLSELFHDLSHRGKRSHRPVDIVIDTLSLRVFASNRDEHRLIIDRNRYQQKLPVLSRRNQGDFWKCLVKRGVEQIVESGFGVRIQQNKMSAMEVTTALHGFHAERTDHERLHMGEENGRRTLSSLFQSIFS